MGASEDSAVSVEVLDPTEVSCTRIMMARMKKKREFRAFQFDAEMKGEYGCA